MNNSVRIGSPDSFLDVDYEFLPGSRGYRDSLGVPEEPDESDSVEIVDVLDFDGNSVYDRLSEQELADLEEKVLASHVDQKYQDCAADFDDNDYPW